jgi:4-amino-4-deoxy-L-arabinose transferase-like glycosyltransferase
MLAGGSWITPPDAIGPFLEKPPLRFWLVAAAMKLGLAAPDEAGHRLVDTVLGAGALVYVFLVARRLGGALSGLGAVFLLVTQRELVTIHGLRSGTMEPLLILAWCGAFHHFLRWTEGRPREAYAVAAWCAVAALAKTVVVAPLLAILALGVALVPAWRARVVAERRAWTRAAALFAALAVPWFVLQLLLHGAAFWRLVFVDHLIARVQSAVDPAHLQPWNFYLAYLGRIVAATWPYLVLGLAALLADARRRPAALLLALWLAVPIALFSLASSKLVHYAYPALPPLGIIGGQSFGLVARLIGDVRRREPLPRALRLAAIAVVVAAVAVAGVVAAVGPMEMVVGPLQARTANAVRPLVVACAGLLALAGRRRAAVALVVGGLALSEVTREHGRALERVRATSRPLGEFVACVAAHSEVPRQIRVSVTTPLGRDHEYYFGRVGWRHWRPDPGHFTRMARDPDRDAPHVMDYASYRDLVPAIAGWPPEMRAAMPLMPLRGHHLIALLPGRFRPCAATGARGIP